MALEKSAGAVVFRRENNKIYYLLLHYPSSAKAAKDYWDFPKGHLDKGEDELAAAHREIEEETGLKDVKFIESFKEWIKYFFRFKGKNIFKIVTFFLTEAKTSEIKVSTEHLGYQWLEYEPALAALTFKNAQGILKKADEFLKKT
ncbi:MAG: diadenosine tetraphosphate hydrolase [Candidatus Nealsonbacteria bacterium CG08_land_8_20_14_0_20_43_11]|uniref:Bis(5'-nucleosyl)-tetraphosphatase [asymmetrical] n=1 Tax=Candidatus Nealsonbacteria bacterium CG08_land_8_20_14_0_20_43_11 TaxID=1974706 RepID=A0A2M6T172_9BACT|nr:MAG: diadenosine tetraphosphate hydrolase [Candidatus Nealsonbacteria bacterium CG08_land_8_20_14_0_20_43_11]